MPVTGLGSQFSFKKETTYGTSITPDRGFTLISESLALEVARLQADTLKGGNYLRLQSSIRPGRKRGSGDLQSLLYDRGCGALFEAMLGTIGTTGSGPYTHTATMGATLPSYTGEVTIGATTGTMRKRMTGMMVDSWEIALTSGQLATLGLTWVYQNETLATASATAGAVASGQVPFTYADGAITYNGSSPGCVRSITFTGNNNLSSDDVCIGNTTISQPVRGGIGEITGQMEVELDPASTTLYTAYTAGTFANVVLTLTAGSNTLTITAAVILNGATPAVAGPGKVMLTIPFTVGAATTDASGFSIVAVNGDSTP